MHKTVQNLINIENEIKSNLNDLTNTNLPKIIAVSKTFKIDKIFPLIEHGHLDFGENKVQEAVDKWSKIKEEKPELKLHMIGRLQTNKVKIAGTLAQAQERLDDLTITLRWIKPVRGKANHQTTGGY
mgnify:CR=1 FL=1